MPKCDKTVVLDGESGKECQTNFLADKCGLSGGWKAFSAAYKLVEGDVVVYFIRLFLINLKLRSILNWFLKKNSINAMVGFATLLPCALFTFLDLQFKILMNFSNKISQ